MDKDHIPGTDGELEPTDATEPSEAAEPIEAAEPADTAEPDEASAEPTEAATEPDLPTEAADLAPDPAPPEKRPRLSLSEARPSRRVGHGVWLMLLLFFGSVAALLWALSGVIGGLMDEWFGPPPTTITRPTTATSIPVTTPPNTVAVRPTAVPSTAAPPPFNAAPPGAAASVIQGQYKTILRLKMRLQSQPNDRRAREELQQTCRAHLVAISEMFLAGHADKAAAALSMLDSLLGRDAAKLALSEQATPYAIKLRAVDSPKAGNLWVIIGKVTNDEPRAVGGLVLRAQLQGPSGAALATAFSVAGNFLDDAQLRSLDYRAIQSALLKAKGRGPVKPGVPLKFMFVFNRRDPKAPKYQVQTFLTWPAGP